MRNRGQNMAGDDSAVTVEFISVIDNSRRAGCRPLRALTVLPLWAPHQGGR